MAEPATYDLVLVAEASSDCSTLDTALRVEVGPLRAGELSALIVDVVNTGTVAHRGPRTVAVALPPGVRYVEQDAGPAWDCAARDALVLCTHMDAVDPAVRDRAVRLPITPDDPEGEPAMLAPGEFDRFSFVIEVASDAPSQAIIRARSLTVGDARPGNDHVHVESAIEGGQGDMALPVLTEPFDTLLDPTVAPAVLLHWLPAGVEYRSAAGVGWACDALAQTVICTVPTESGATSPAVFDPRVTVDVMVGSDAPEHLLLVAGLNSVRARANEQVPEAGYCTPVVDSTTPVTTLPPFCRPSGRGP